MGILSQEQVIFVQAGDYIELESNLGKGTVRAILMKPDPNVPEARGTFPMIQFTDNVTGVTKWCTYIVVKKWQRVGGDPGLEYRLGA